MRPAKILTIAAFALAPAFEASAQTLEPKVKEWQAIIAAYEQPNDSTLSPTRIKYIRALNEYGEYLEAKTGAEQTLRLSENSTGFEGKQQEAETQTYWQNQLYLVEGLKKVELRRGVSPRATTAPAEPAKP